MLDLKEKFIMLMDDLTERVIDDEIFRGVDCFISDEKLDAWGDILTEADFDALAKYFDMHEFCYSDGAFLMHIDEAVFQMTAFAPGDRFVSKDHDRGVYYEYNFANDACEYRILSHSVIFRSGFTTRVSWHNVDCESVLEGFQLFILFMWHNLYSNITNDWLLRYFSDIEQRWRGLFEE